mmetsp:Transcript_23598/g.55993  ORF Transcript_23598/g.55993 Transcript_23598/m.55993 type:complete len:240 (+) Transcript_23598:252-971(+)
MQVLDVGFQRGNAGLQALGIAVLVRLLQLVEEECQLLLAGLLLHHLFLLVFWRLAAKSLDVVLAQPLFELGAVPLVFLLLSHLLLYRSLPLLLLGLLLGLRHEPSGQLPLLLLLLIRLPLLLCPFLSELLLQLKSLGLRLLLAHFGLRRRRLQQGQVDVSIIRVLGEPVDGILQAGVVCLVQGFLRPNLGEAHLQDLLQQVLPHLLLDLRRIGIAHFAVVHHWGHVYIVLPRHGDISST